MHHDFARPAFLQSLRAFHGPAVIQKAQAHLGADHLVRGHGLAHRADDAPQQLRVLQQRRAPAVAVHHLGRAAEIQVHAVAPHTGHAGRVIGQTVGVRAQQLGTHRHPGRRASAMGQLRDHPHVGALG